jgi:trans-aconitate methyltransferase
MNTANQSWYPNHYNEHASFVSELGLPVLKLLNPQVNEKILDLGCGDGTLGLKISQLGAVVIGVDSSSSMVESAKNKGLDAFVMNGENLTFINEFDAVFSNAALHWMRDYSAVIRGIKKSLKTEGRFIGEFGGKGNIKVLTDAIEIVFNNNKEFGNFINPWYFPSTDEYANALSEEGFEVETIELIPRPTALKTGVREWLNVFANHVISNLNPFQSEVFLKEMEDTVKPSLYSKEDGWIADYVRLRFSAKKLEK